MLPLLLLVLRLLRLQPHVELRSISSAIPPALWQWQRQCVESINGIFGNKMIQCGIVGHHIPRGTGPCVIMDTKPHTSRIKKSCNNGSYTPMRKSCVSCRVLVPCRVSCALQSTSESSSQYVLSRRMPRTSRLCQAPFMRRVIAGGQELEKASWESPCGRRPNAVTFQPEKPCPQPWLSVRRRLLLLLVLLLAARNPAGVLPHTGLGEGNVAG